MTLEEAIVTFGQIPSDDFDSIELESRDYKRLVKWLNELKLARESAFSDIGVAARAISEKHQLEEENDKLRQALVTACDLMPCFCSCDLCPQWEGWDDGCRFKREVSKLLGIEVS